MYKLTFYLLNDFVAASQWFKCLDVFNATQFKGVRGTRSEHTGLNVLSEAHEKSKLFGLGIRDEEII